MIPKIEHIISDLLAGKCTQDEALSLIYQHMDAQLGDERTLRDAFAVHAPQAMRKYFYSKHDTSEVEWRWKFADEMMRAR